MLHTTVCPHKGEKKVADGCDKRTSVVVAITTFFAPLCARFLHWRFSVCTKIMILVSQAYRTIITRAIFYIDEKLQNMYVIRKKSKI